MFRPRQALVPLLVLVLSACAGIETRSDYDPGSVERLNGYRTYAWEPVPQTQSSPIYNPIVEARVRAAVDKQLQAQGYQEVSQNPDFRIGWHGAIDQKLDVQTVDHYYGYAWDPWYSPFYLTPSVPETRIREYQEGTLILDFIDAASKKLVWRGTAQAELKQSASVHKRQERLEEAVRDILKDFPPKPKK
ncbi:protein of unknown function [Stigmatella aurantiaca]|uniref:DUF4136 domain-containing protein n=1 Tax=Stigmatella aurantiaca TaxID=41 RepID=A0A1H7U0Y9_STIAU|nr:DUF4136 domain-containing protein [Stigmatella aurantiaca]SEL90455.1 protein of unknown function [Stigmatella aurantiaca]